MHGCVLCAVCMCALCVVLRLMRVCAFVYACKCAYLCVYVCIGRGGGYCAFMSKDLMRLSKLRRRTLGFEAQPQLAYACTWSMPLRVHKALH